MDEEIWIATPSRHEGGVLLRIPDQAFAVTEQPTVSLRVPGTDLQASSKTPCSVREEGGDLLVHVPAELADQLLPDSPYVLEIPELHLVGAVENWPPSPPPSPASSTKTRPSQSTPPKNLFVLSPAEQKRNIILAVVAGVLLFFALPLLLAWLFWTRLFHLSPAPLPSKPQAAGSVPMLRGLDGGFHPKSASLKEALP